MFPTAEPDPDVTSAQAVETVLSGMFAKAQAEGERFLDVASGVLNRTISGDAHTAKGVARCCRVMRRMMSAGDTELSSSRGGSSRAVLIRYALPRYAGSRHFKP